MRAFAIGIALGSALALPLAACGSPEVERAGMSREQGPSVGTPGADPRTGGRASETPGLRGNVGGPAAATASPAATQRDARPIADAHIHYSSDAWAALSPEEAIARLRAAGVVRAFVSSTPDEGTQRLYARAPDLVVPVLRPYRTRDDIGSWTRDPSVVAYLERTYVHGVHRGIGEFHLAPGEAALPVVRQVIALATREGLFLHAHADERAIDELARAAPGVAILWAHAGMSASAETVAALLERHQDLWVELALRGDVMSGGRLDAAWRATLEKHAGRILVGTDTWVPSRWDDVVSGHERTRAWLAQLPEPAARRIASETFERLLAQLSER